MLKSDDITYTSLSISVIYGSLPESVKREMRSLPRPRIYTGLPPIPFTPSFEAINDDKRFVLLMMTLFSLVSIM